MGAHQQEVRRRTTVVKTEPKWHTVSNRILSSSRLLPSAFETPGVNLKGETALPVLLEDLSLYFNLPSLSLSLIKNGKSVLCFHYSISSRRLISNVGSCQHK